jgi:predicted RNA-binding protein with PUA domain
MVLGIKKMKDNCVVCKTKSIYNIDENIFFRIGYIEGAGQLCLDCYGETYNFKPKLQGMKKLINKIKTKWRSINR